MLLASEKKEIMKRQKKTEVQKFKKKRNKFMSINALYLTLKAYSIFSHE